MLFDTLAPQSGDPYKFYSIFNLCGLKWDTEEGRAEDGWRRTEGRRRQAIGSS